MCAACSLMCLDEFLSSKLHMNVLAAAGIWQGTRKLLHTWADCTRPGVWGDCSQDLQRGCNNLRKAVSIAARDLEQQDSPTTASSGCSMPGVLEVQCRALRGARCWVDASPPCRCEPAGGSSQCHVLAIAIDVLSACRCNSSSRKY